MWHFLIGGRIMMEEAMTQRKSYLPDQDHLRTQFENYLRRPSKQRLTAIVRLTHAPIWELALRITGNHADAADLCQDVFLSLLMKPPAPGSIRSPLGYLSARVLTVDRRRRRSYDRRRKREERAAREILTNIETPEDVEVLRSALDELPERTETVLKLRYFAGLKNRDVAATLGLSVRTVEEYLRKGREALELKMGTRILGALSLLAVQSPSSQPGGFLKNLLRVIENGDLLASEAMGAEGMTASSSNGSSATVSNVASRSSMALWALSAVGVVLALAVVIIINHPIIIKLIVVLPVPVPLTISEFDAVVTEVISTGNLPDIRIVLFISFNTIALILIDSIDCEGIKGVTDADSPLL